MIKRIVMMEGGVETLSYFSHQMAGEFQKLGYAVFFYDLNRRRAALESCASLSDRARRCL